jgi:hypothetical protein
MNPFEVQEVINKAVATGAAVNLEAGLKIGYSTPDVPPAGLYQTIDFKNTTVNINGKVEVLQGTTVLNTAQASVNFDKGASLVLNNNPYIIIHGAPLGQISDAYAVDYVGDVSKPTETSEEIAVLKYTMGPIADCDYTTGKPIGVRSGVTKIYVLDELVVPVNATSGSIKIVALGTVDLAGTPPEGIISGAVDINKKPLPELPTVTLGSSAVITSNAGKVELGLNRGLVTSTWLPAIEVKSGKEFVIKDAAGGLTIQKVDGDVPLQINGTFTGPVAINGGKGDVIFNDAQTGNVAFTISTTGTTTFAKAAILGAGSDITGDVLSKAKLTIASGAEGVAFHGDVTLYHNAVSITPLEPIFSITDGGYVSFDAGKTLSVGGASYTVSGVAGVVPVTPVLRAVTDAVLGASAQDIDFISDLFKYDEKSFIAAKGIRVSSSNGNFWIYTGQVQVAPDATLTLSTTTVIPAVQSVSGTRADSGYLGVAAGATLSFLNTGSVINLSTPAQNLCAVVSYGTTGTGTLKPVDGAVTFGFGEIAGEGATLNVAGAVAFDVEEDKTFRLSGVNLNLATAGSLEVPFASGPGEVSRLVLINKGQITLADAKSVATLLRGLTSGTGAATVSGIGAVALGASAKDGANLISLADSGGGTVTVSVGNNPASDFIFSKGQVKFAQ